LHEENAVADLIFLSIICAFFLASGWLVDACEHMKG